MERGVEESVGLGAKRSDASGTIGE